MNVEFKYDFECGDLVQVTQFPAHTTIPMQRIYTPGHIDGAIGEILSISEKNKHYAYAHLKLSNKHCTYYFLVDLILIQRKDKE